MTPTKKAKAKHTKVPGSGRKKAFNEESALLTVRVPVSQKERLKPLIKNFIANEIKLKDER